MTLWKMGDAAIAIASADHRSGFSIEKGASYTVTEVDKHPLTGDLGFQIDNQYDDLGRVVMWFAHYFRRPFHAMSDLVSLLTAPIPILEDA